MNGNQHQILSPTDAMINMLIAFNDAAKFVNVEACERKWLRDFSHDPASAAYFVRFFADFRAMKKHASTLVAAADRVKG